VLQHEMAVPADAVHASVRELVLAADSVFDVCLGISVSDGLRRSAMRPPHQRHGMTLATGRI